MSKANEASPAAKAATLSDLLGGRNSWAVKVSRVERVQVVGQKADYDDCLQWLTENGYSVTRAGPYFDAEMFPKVDMKRFLFEAERAT